MPTSAEEGRSGGGQGERVKIQAGVTGEGERGSVIVFGR